ncbi:hypothetical protein JW758_06175 [Candidatus Peregrinibacteria bacterium]|nr:hypothetical protein [Candidatus Peregrinibacteria bacterium]
MLNTTFIKEPLSQKNLLFSVLIGISIVISLAFAYIYSASASGNIVKITSKWGQMENPTIAIDNSDNTILAWQAKGEKSYEIMFQKFDNYGIPVGFPKRANRYRPNDQQNPRIAMGKDGDYVMVWQSYQQDGSGTGIYGRHFSADGKKISDEFRANTFLIGNQSNPDIAMNEAGQYVIVWMSEGQNGFLKDIHAQIFNSEGEKIGKEIKVSSGERRIEDSPSVAIDRKGNFMVVWQGYKNDDWNIYGQIFDSTGNRKSDNDILVNKTTEFEQQHPDVVTIASNKFMVVWSNQTLHDILETTMENISGQIFMTSGNKSRNEFMITSPIFGHQEHPSVTQISLSEAYITWENYFKHGDDANAWNIYGKVMLSNGTGNSDLEQISDVTDRWNKNPMIASNGDREIGVIWTSLNHKKYKTAIHYKKISD